MYLEQIKMTQLEDLKKELKKVEHILFRLDHWNRQRNLMNDYNPMWRKYENRRCEIVDTINNIR